jgi:hypothetical protein
MLERGVRIPRPNLGYIALDLQRPHAPACLSQLCTSCQQLPALHRRHCIAVPTTSDSCTPTTMGPRSFLPPACRDCDPHPTSSARRGVCSWRVVALPQPLRSCSSTSCSSTLCCVLPLRHRASAAGAVQSEGTGTEVAAVGNSVSASTSNSITQSLAVSQQPCSVHVATHVATGYSLVLVLTLQTDILCLQHHHLQSGVLPFAYTAACCGADSRHLWQRDFHRAAQPANALQWCPSLRRGFWALLLLQSACSRACGC